MSAGLGLACWSVSGAVDGDRSGVLTQQCRVEVVGEGIEHPPATAEAHSGGGVDRLIDLDVDVADDFEEQRDLAAASAL